MPNPSLALLAVLVAAAAGWPVNAADPPAGAARDCTKIADYREMVGCFAASSQAADAEVTRLYEALLNKMEPSAKRDLLRSAQAAWLAYRVAQYSLVSSAVEGGSFQPTIRNTCSIDLARARIKELEYQLTCREGDMSCVVPNRQP